MSFTGIEDAVTTIRVPRPAHAATAQLHHSPMPSVAHDRRLESIVVPLDGTDFAEHAIPLAIAIARRSGSVLSLVRAFTPAETMTLYPGSDAFDVIEGQLRTDARCYLDRVRRQIAARTNDVTVMTHLVEAPRIFEALARVSKTADLIVMATHGRGWLGRFFHGSVARDMLRNRKKPIIYIRGYDSPVDFSADPVPRQLAIALDGRKSSERVLDAAGMIAEVTGANSTLLHIDDPRETDERFVNSSPEGYLRWTRREIAETLGVSTRVVRNAASSTQGILSYVDEAEADLIAVTTRSAPPAFGSTTENLIRKSRVPVLVVRE